MLEIEGVSDMNPDDIDTSKQLPDDYEWGRDGLREIAEAFGLGYADDDLLFDIKRGAARWQLPPPKWTRIEVGCYELKTPDGLLTVQRMFGWAVRRDGTPLVWYLGGQIINFDKLEQAQTSAVLHARDVGVTRFCDSTRWAQ